MLLPVLLGDDKGRKSPPAGHTHNTCGCRRPRRQPRQLFEGLVKPHTHRRCLTPYFSVGAQCPNQTCMGLHPVLASNMSLQGSRCLCLCTGCGQRKICWPDLLHSLPGHCADKAACGSIECAWCRQNTTPCPEGLMLTHGWSSACGVLQTPRQLCVHCMYIICVVLTRAWRVSKGEGSTPMCLHV